MVAQTARDSGDCCHGIIGCLGCSQVDSSSDLLGHLQPKFVEKEAALVEVVASGRDLSAGRLKRH